MIASVFAASVLAPRGSRAYDFRAVTISGEPMQSGGRAAMHLHDLRIGARVRQRRLELGMSQARLASHLSLTFQQIQKYENGLNRISASTLIEIARALGAPAAWFLEETAIGPPTTRDRVINVIDGLADLVRDLISESLTEVQLGFANDALGDLPLRSISSIGKGA